jgi:polyphenol oxidase
MFFIEPLRKAKKIASGFSGSNADLFDGIRVVDGLDMGINTVSPLAETEKNREYFLDLIGLKPKSLAIVKQVHGNRVLYADCPGLIGEADGLITDVRNLTLGILVADCAVVLIADVRKKIVCALHAGWRGAASNIVGEGLQAMKDLGAEDFIAWISPCISPEHFEVGHDVAAQFPSAYVTKSFFPKQHIDLQGLLMHQLVVGGVTQKKIESDGRCTFSDTRFFSYRRQGVSAGRMLGLIAAQ